MLESEISLAHSGQSMAYPQAGSTALALIVAQPLTGAKKTKVAVSSLGFYLSKVAETHSKMDHEVCIAMTMANKPTCFCPMQGLASARDCTQ
jgi:hypothetical protein